MFDLNHHHPPFRVCGSHPFASVDPDTPNNIGKSGLKTKVRFVGNSSGSSACRSIVVNPVSGSSAGGLTLELITNVLADILAATRAMPWEGGSNGARNSSIGIYALPTGIRKCLIWTDSGLVSPKIALTQALWGRVSTKQRP